MVGTQEWGPTHQPPTHQPTIHHPPPNHHSSGAAAGWVLLSYSCCYCRPAVLLLPTQVVRTCSVRKCSMEFHVMPLSQTLHPSQVGNERESHPSTPWLRPRREPLRLRSPAPKPRSTRRPPPRPDPRSRPATLSWTWPLPFRRSSYQLSCTSDQLWELPPSPMLSWPLARRGSSVLNEVRRTSWKDDSYESALLLCALYVF